MNSKIQWLVAIILSGAQGMENGSVLTCPFPHMTCIPKDYKMEDPWLPEI